MIDSLEIKKPRACASCIVDTLEKELDPFDALEKGNDVDFMKNIITNNCSSECLQ